MIKILIFILVMLLSFISYGQEAYIIQQDNSIYKTQHLVLIRDANNRYPLKLYNKKCVQYSKKILQPKDKVSVTIYNGKGTECDPHYRNFRYYYKLTPMTNGVVGGDLFFVWEQRVTRNGHAYMRILYNASACMDGTINCGCGPNDRRCDQAAVLPYLGGNQYKLFPEF